MLWLMSLFIIIVSYYIFNLFWPYNYTHFSIIYICLSKYIYRHQKWWPYWIAVAWDNFAAPITYGMDTVCALCRSLMDFLTRRSFKTPLPDMLKAEWYYGDTGLDHIDDNTFVLTQLPQKKCTATNIWAGFDTIFDKEDSN